MATLPLMAHSSDAVQRASFAIDSIAVRCRGVTKMFGAGEARTMALAGVDLEINRGALTLLVGPSGCGKTTLISIIAGLLNPTEGSIEVFGTALQSLNSNQLVRFRSQNIGFVFQQYNLLPAMTAAENAAVPLLIQGVSRRQAIRVASDMLATVGLAEKAKAMPNQLSGGQQQRVAIARALITQPRLMVCDEPTAALDTNSGQRVMELLSSVAVHPERAVIIVTHDTRVLGFGDRRITMADGLIQDIEDRNDTKWS